MAARYSFLLSAVSRVMRSRGATIMVVASCAIAAPTAVVGGAGTGSAAAAVATSTAPAEAAGSPDADIAGLRTKTSRTYRLRDGRLYTRVWSRAVNHRDAGGVWRQIDDTLVTAGGGSYRNRAGALQVELPADLSRPVRVSVEGHSFGFSLRGATGDLSVNGSTANYANALPGADVRYSVLGEALKEEMVLRSRSAPTTFRFALTLSPGLVAAENSGSIIVSDASGRRVATMPAPFMYQDRQARRVVSDDVSMRLRSGARGHEVVVAADAGWVRARLTEGPVVIDPGLGTTLSAACSLEQRSPTASSCTGWPGQLRVGYDGAARSRSLVKFDLPAQLEQEDVQDATLSLYPNEMTTSNPTAVSVHRVTRGWTGGTIGATWATYDGVNAWASPGGDFDPVADDTLSSPAASYPVHWKVTDMVRRWVQGSAPNHGLVLKAADETVNNVISYSSFNTIETDPTLGVYSWARTGRLGQYRFEEEPGTDRMRLAVNVANGNLLVEERDLQIAGTGIPLVVARTFNNLGPPNLDGSFDLSARMGRWKLSAGQDLRVSELPGGDVAYQGPSGFTGVFKKESGGYRKPPGLNLKLEKNADGTFVITANKTDEKLRFRTDGRLSSHEDRNGNKITVGYTVVGQYTRMTQITDTQGRVTNFGYDTGSFRTTMTDPSGRVHTYTYSGNELVSYRDPSGRTTTYTYSSGSLQRIDTPRHNQGLGPVQISFTYDTYGRVATLTRTGNHVTTFAYQQPGTACGDTKNTVVTDPRNNKTTYCWDGQGRVDEVYDALGHKRTTKYDSQSNVTEVTGAGGNAATPGYATKASYDGNDNLTTLQQPGDGNPGSLGGGGPLWQFGYGAGSEAFKLKSATDPESNQRNYNYDANGDISTITQTKANGADSLVTIRYNGKDDGDCTDQTGVPKGTIRCSIDGKGTKTFYEHDTKGNLTKINPPSPLGSITYTYDGLSRVATMTDGKGQKRTFTYDSRDRVTKVEFRTAAGTLESTVNYGYDGDGNLTSRTDPLGTTSYRYDGRNLLTEETFPGTRINRYAYDGAKNLASFTNAAGTTLYAYNKVNRLSQLTDPDNLITTYDYNADNSRTLTRYPNGVTETRTHTKAERVKTIKATNSSGQVLTDFRYNYLRPSGDESDLRHKTTDGQRNTDTTYGYDHLGRLISQNTTGAASENYSFDYDVNSNRIYSRDENGTEANYSYNDANQLCWTVTGAVASRDCASPPAGATRYSYDAGGNLTSSTDGYAFGYNARNQTVSITPAGGSAQPIKYLDAGQTEMVERAGLVYVNNGLGTGQTFGLRGGDSYVREADGTLHSQKTASGRAYYLTDNHPGSVAGLTDGSGNMAVRYRYDPFGQVESTTGPLANPLRFAAAEHVGELKLYKMGERWYDPNLGRFTQQDPLNQPVDPRQANRYVYAGSDPVNARDPAGMYSFWEGVADVASVAGVFEGAAATIASGVATAACVTALLPAGPAVAACAVPAAMTVFSAYGTYLSARHAVEAVSH